MSFWVFRCRVCGQWSVKELRTSILKGIFLCRYCRKSRKIKPANKGHIAPDYQGPFEHPKQATLVCQELNRRRNDEKNK